MDNFTNPFYTQNNTTSDNSLITVEELSEALMIGRNAAYDLLRSGEVKAFRIGSKWKIPKSSLNEYIHESTQKSFHKK